MFDSLLVVLNGCTSGVVDFMVVFLLQRLILVVFEVCKLTLNLQNIKNEVSVLHNLPFK